MNEKLPPRPGAIPPRPASQGEAFHPAPAPKPLTARDFDSTILFAEVEVAGTREPGGPAVPAPFSLPAGPRIIDPIRQKFYEMRRLAARNPFARNDAEIFYRQAKFMEDFEDDWPGDAPYKGYFPCYQTMGHEQLRAYFTWRTRARRGEYPPTSSAYVCLYIYELLANVGASDPGDGLTRLMAVWEAVRDADPSLNRHMLQWLRDYHIYYELPRSFADFAFQNGLGTYYPELSADGGDSLAMWESVSTYSITKSKFRTDENREFVDKCVLHAMRRVQEACAAGGLESDSLVYEVSGRRMAWYPFERALFYDWLPQNDRTVRISARSAYTCRGGRWTSSGSYAGPEGRSAAGFILKHAESCLRKIQGYKHKLTADPDMISHKAAQALDIAGIDLAKVIEAAVREFVTESKRTVVTVDFGSLERIRKEALGTQERLIVDESPAPPPAAPLLLNIDAEEDAEAEQSSPPDVWTQFGLSLTREEAEALTAALGGPGAFARYAAGRGLMPEVLADGINGKAADTVGDAVLDMDGGGEVYGEYVENVKRVLRIES